MTAKADRVRELMSHPELQEAFANVRQFYLEAFARLPLAADGSDPQVFLDLRRMIELLGQVEKDLENMIQAGNVEDFREAQPDYLGDLRNGGTRAIN